MAVDDLTPEHRRHHAAELFNHAWTLMRWLERAPELAYELLAGDLATIP